MADVSVTRASYESSYQQLGFAAQRMYPNEELLRFFGTYYFGLPLEERRRLVVLEVGCGSGANLWMIAREGFQAHGLDLSPEGLALCGQMLEKWGATASLKQGDMTALPYEAAAFDVLVDVFSSNCLDERGFERFLDEAARVLRPGGRLFTYTPSKASDVFRDPGPAARLDASTLDGIRREGAPFYGQLYPFRFSTPGEVAFQLVARGFEVLRNERVGRTYRNGAEYFEFVSLHAQKR